MKNVKLEVTNDGQLIITVNLKEAGEISASGKSIVLASTKGNVPIPSRPEVKLGLNVYMAK